MTEPKYRIWVYGPQCVRAGKEYKGDFPEQLGDDLTLYEFSSVAEALDHCRALYKPYGTPARANPYNREVARTIAAKYPLCADIELELPDLMRSAGAQDDEVKHVYADSDIWSQEVLENCDYDLRELRAAVLRNMVETIGDDLASSYNEWDSDKAIAALVTKQANLLNRLVGLSVDESPETEML